MSDSELLRRQFTARGNGVSLKRRLLRFTPSTLGGPARKPGISVDQRSRERRRMNPRISAHRDRSVPNEMCRGSADRVRLCSVQLVRHDASNVVCLEKCHGGGS